MEAKILEAQQEDQVARLYRRVISANMPPVARVKNPIAVFDPQRNIVYLDTDQCAGLSEEELSAIIRRAEEMPTVTVQ